MLLLQINCSPELAFMKVSHDRWSTMGDLVRIGKSRPSLKLAR